jgi:hypothetical protein
VPQIRLADWLKQFRALHERAKKGALSPDERRTYEGAREELARAFLAAQRVQSKPGQSPRAAMRVSRALQADLELSSGSVRALTLDLAIGGFGALLAQPPAQGERIEFSLRLPGGDRVAGAARVAGVVASAGSARVAFAFDDVGAEDLERLELLVFDTVLDQVRTDAVT